MSVNTELQALLTKMGGEPLESDSNSDLIKKISNAYESGGGSSGGGVLAVRFTAGEPAVPPTAPEGTLPVITTVGDKSWNDITKAIGDGKIPIAIFGYDDYGASFGLIEETEFSEEDSVYNIYVSAVNNRYDFINTSPTENIVGYFVEGNDADHPVIS